MMKNQKKAESQIPPRRSSMNATKRKVMLATLMLNKAGFLGVRGLIIPEDVKYVDAGEGLVWQLVCDFFRKHKRLPDGFELRPKVERALDAASTELSEKDVKNAWALVNLTFGDTVDSGIATADHRAEWAVRTAGEFLDSIRW